MSKSNGRMGTMPLSSMGSPFVIAPLLQSLQSDFEIIYLPFKVAQGKWSRVVASKRDFDLRSWSPRRGMMREKDQHQKAHEAHRKGYKTDYLEHGFHSTTACMSFPSRKLLSTSKSLCRPRNGIGVSKRTGLSSPHAKRSREKSPKSLCS